MGYVIGPSFPKDGRKIEHALYNYVHDRRFKSNNGYYKIINFDFPAGPCFRVRYQYGTG